jgi:hypothetical protein
MLTGIDTTYGGIMNSKTAWITVLAITATVAVGCSGPSASTDTAPSDTASPMPPATTAPADEAPPLTAEAPLEPVSYKAPPLPASAEAYAVAPGVKPAAAKACAALNIGAEVYAAIGKSTLSADSTTEHSAGGLLCSFTTDGHTPSTPNFLALTVSKDPVYSYETLAKDSAPGWARQDVSGLGDAARFYESGPTDEQASHMMYTLKEPLLVGLLVKFTNVPDSADLSVHRYGAIVSKVYSQVGQ